MSKAQAAPSALEDGRLESGRAVPATAATPPNGITWRSYYYAGSQRVAMRVQSASQNTVYYLLNDHLNSTAITVDSSGNKLAELRYKPWGETRYTSGATPTTFQYTGQRNEAAISLYFYGARWYNPALGRFTQADTIIPLQSQGVQAWDRYAYVNNNPIRYNDPTGHDVGCGGRDASECASKSITKKIEKQRPALPPGPPYRTTPAPTLPAAPPMTSLEAYYAASGPRWESAPPNYGVVGYKTIVVPKNIDVEGAGTVIGSKVAEKIFGPPGAVALEIMGTGTDIASGDVEAVAQTVLIKSAQELSGVGYLSDAKDMIDVFSPAFVSIPVTGPYPLYSIGPANQPACTHENPWPAIYKW